MTQANDTNKEPPRVYADFNNADRIGRLRLNCQGTREDLERQKLEFRENMKLTLYMEDIECVGTVTYSQEERIWVAKINWNEVRDR